MNHHLIKVLHLPGNVGGNAFGLAEAERRLGIDAKVLTFGKTIYEFPTDLYWPLENKNLFQQFLGRLSAFIKYRKKFDIYHFNFGSSLLHAPQFGLNLTDLPFYDSKAKKIFTYQGCDARQKYPTMERNKNLYAPKCACDESLCYEGVCNSGKRDIWRKKAIEKAEKYADHFFTLNPDLFYYLPREKTSFLPYSIPYFNTIMPKKTPFFENDKIRIVHAPTQRATKGTIYILKALEELKHDYGSLFELEIIEKMPHEQALECYRNADLFIDQVLIGWYGGVAVEVMKMGIPVAVYINEDHAQYIPKEMAEELPFINLNVNNIKEKLKMILKDREILKEHAQKSLAFVNKWHDPINAAKITSKLYQQLTQKS